MLVDPKCIETPWPYFTASAAFSAAQLQHLEDLFQRTSEWERHSSVLYDGAMSDVSAAVDLDLKIALIARMRELTKLPLTSRLQVNLQRMDAGEDVRPHSDQPLLGYEIARLVVQLNRDWRPEDGGLLQVHPDAEGASTGGRFLPEWNHAFGFVLSEHSYHSVSRVLRPRKSVVFYFWHRGNSEALARYLHDQTRDLRFGDLPPALDDSRRRADAELPEDRSFAAATAACLLRRWGYEPDVQHRAYRAVAWPQDGRSKAVADEPAFAVLLACWAVRLTTQCFDPIVWEEIRAIQTTFPCPTRLTELGALIAG